MIIYQRSAGARFSFGVQVIFQTRMTVRVRPPYPRSPRTHSLADKLSFIGFWLQSKGISPVSAILIY